MGGTFSKVQLKASKQRANKPSNESLSYFDIWEHQEKLGSFIEDMFDLFLHGLTGKQRIEIHHDVWHLIYKFCKEIWLDYIHLMVGDTGMQFNKTSIYEQKHGIPGFTYPYDHTGSGTPKDRDPYIAINSKVGKVYQNEIRCVGVRESQNGWCPGIVELNLKLFKGKRKKPLILYLCNHNPIHWYIYAEDKVIKNCKIAEIYVNAFYWNESAVVLNDGLKCDKITVTRDKYLGFGTAKDLDESQKMLIDVMLEFGDRPLSMIAMNQAIVIDVYVGKD